MQKTKKGNASKRVKGNRLLWGKRDRSTNTEHDNGGRKSKPERENYERGLREAKDLLVSWVILAVVFTAIHGNNVITLFRLL